MECGVNPSRRCLCRQHLATIGLDKSKAEVDASVFPQLKQSESPIAQPKRRSKMIHLLKPCVVWCS